MRGYLDVEEGTRWKRGGVSAPLCHPTMYQSMDEKPAIPAIQTFP